MEAKVHFGCLLLMTERGEHPLLIGGMHYCFDDGKCGEKLSFKSSASPCSVYFPREDLSNAPHPLKVLIEILGTHLQSLCNSASKLERSYLPEPEIAVRSVVRFGLWRHFPLSTTRQQKDRPGTTQTAEQHFESPPTFLSNRTDRDGVSK